MKSQPWSQSSVRHIIGTSEPRPNGVGCSQNGVARYRPTLLRETGHLREKAEKEEGRKTEEKDPGAERRISGES
jgi:hypothetical protein